MDSSKYTAGYFRAPSGYNKWAERDRIESAPIWCSVDMRDGNQSLVIPMSLDEKIEYFRMLVDIGFKEIEVGFPASNDTEYEFVRALIDGDMIPDDVTIQVLTQCREHIIRRTFEAIDGAPHAIIHFYNSTSAVQREQVFGKSKDEIKEMAVDGAKLIKSLASEYHGSFRYEYSPESFTGTEPEFALEVVNAVLDVLEPSYLGSVIVNLPVTVEMSLPHVYASQVEFMHENLKYRENIVLSLHPHNDRGTGVADAELGLLAGADRVEGTLFGNGERTGNVDLITLALNMYSHGVDVKLELSDLPHIIETYEKCTRMHVGERTPYSGELVFAAFSGGHQDAITKGIKYREAHGQHVWNVPYLAIDPHDIGRRYGKNVIRFNSQSGKGGIGYFLERKFGYILPTEMREHLSYIAKGISDREHRELKSDELLEIFRTTYFKLDAPIGIIGMNFTRSDGRVEVSITFTRDGIATEVTAVGNGSIDCLSNALKAYTQTNYRLEIYTEHSMKEEGSKSIAAAYIGIRSDDGQRYFGAGCDTDIIHASANALISAFNNMMTSVSD